MKPMIGYVLRIWKKIMVSSSFTVQFWIAQDRTQVLKTHLTTRIPIYSNPQNKVSTSHQTHIHTCSLSLHYSTPRANVRALFEHIPQARSSIYKKARESSMKRIHLCISKRAHASARTHTRTREKSAKNRRNRLGYIHHAQISLPHYTRIARAVQW